MREATPEIGQTCCQCGFFLPRSSFSASLTKPSGLQPRCLSCTKIYRRHYYERFSDRLKRKAAAQRRSRPGGTFGFVYEALASGACSVCGSNDGPRNFKLRNGPRQFCLWHALTEGRSEAAVGAHLQDYDVVCERCSAPGMSYAGAYMVDRAPDDDSDNR